MTHTKVTNAGTTLENVPEQMLALWERRIPSIQPLPLNETRKTIMSVLFKTAFCSDMMRWAKFVDIVAESDFLMGREHVPGHVSLDSALRPKTCVEILEGMYSNFNGSYTLTPVHVTPAELQEALVAAFDSKRRIPLLFDSFGSALWFVNCDSDVPLRSQDPKRQMVN
jgi:hypothetical protein